MVRVTDDGGNRVIVWVVGVDIDGPEPIYRIEIPGGDPNHEVKESEIAPLHAPHV